MYGNTLTRMLMLKSLYFLYSHSLNERTIIFQINKSHFQGVCEKFIVFVGKSRLLQCKISKKSIIFFLPIQNGIRIKINAHYLNKLKKRVSPSGH